MAIHSLPGPFLWAVWPFGVRWGLDGVVEVEGGKCWLVVASATSSLYVVKLLTIINKRKKNIPLTHHHLLCGLVLAVCRGGARGVAVVVVYLR